MTIPVTLKVFNPWWVALMPYELAVHSGAGGLTPCFNATAFGDSLYVLCLRTQGGCGELTSRLMAARLFQAFDSSRNHAQGSWLQTPQTATSSRISTRTPDSGMRIFHLRSVVA